MLGNLNHPNYHQFWQHQALNNVRNKRGHLMPPPAYAGCKQTGHQHLASRIIPEPNITLQCADCGPLAVFEGMDHFKYYCCDWKARVHLAQGFAELHSQNLLQGPYILNNDAINEMMARGVTLERIASQPKDWLPNEPIYEYDRITGLNVNTGIIPTDVWFNLPAEFRMAPVAQDNTPQARMAAQEHLGAHVDELRMNSPAAVDHREGMRVIEAMYDAQMEIRNRVMPHYMALMQEYREMKERVERLESQIGSAKHSMNVLQNHGMISAFAHNIVDANFDGPAHVDYIPPRPTTVHPAAPVPAKATSIAMQNSEDDIDFLDSIE